MLRICGALLLVVSLPVLLAGNAEAPAADNHTDRAPLAVRVRSCASTPTPTWRTGVDVVPLNVSVIAADQRLVSGLTVNAFRVLEDGVPQQVTYFEREGAPLAVLVLIDRSDSMTSRLGKAQQAALSFLTQLRPDDLASIAYFNTHLEVAARFTRDRRELAASIPSVHANGLTALYDAIRFGMEQFQALLGSAPERVYRRVAVLLSDGENSRGVTSYAEALKAAHRADATIYTIALRDESELSPKQLRFTLAGYSEARFVMTRLAQETGGRAFALKSTDDLDAIYASIASEVRALYVLGYVPKTPHDGTWHRLAVQVTQPGLRTRSRTGYFAPEAEPAGNRCR